MSRPLSRHRKSQSTSALSVIASSSPSSSHAAEKRTTSREKRRPFLPVVDESTSASLSVLPGLSSGSSSRDLASPNERGKRRIESPKEIEASEFEGWVNDIRSLRSSTRRRLAALNNLERTLLIFCQRGLLDGMGQDLGYVVKTQLHDPLISLLSRHAQSLRQRSSHSSLPSGDELASTLIPELEIIVSILQGLCLVSRKSKRAVGQRWVMELFIDLLLLLRTQPILSTCKQPIVYCILDFMFCLLVDTPTNARVFEELGGLEAVTRLLKGTSVVREVRMKCIEFLYFYLLPEQTTERTVSSSSSGSSAASQLYPPSPLSSLTFSEGTTIGSINNTHLSPDSARSPNGLARDIDISFTPMTPRKPQKPSLGYHTPSTRRSSGSMNPSPLGVPQSPSSRRLSGLIELEQIRESTSNEDLQNEEEEAVGLGLGIPASPRRQITSQRSLSNSTTSSAATPMMPQTPQTPRDPFTLAPDSRTSSGSSSVTVKPGMTKSSTQPNLAVLRPQPSQQSERSSSTRRMSHKIESRQREEQSEKTETAQIPRIRHSRTHSQLAEMIPSDVRSSNLPQPRPSSTGLTRSSSSRAIIPRQSLPASHAVAVPKTPALIPPVPTVPDLPAETRRAPSSSKAQRSFPANLTKGIPPSASSPSLAMGNNNVLRASRRISSGQMLPPSLPVRSAEKPPHKSGHTILKQSEEKLYRPSEKHVRSVEEKKGLLGEWLGNVDALVQGVDKVGFWGSIRGSKGGKA